jgi:hypothetical protein
MRKRIKCSDWRRIPKTPQASIQRGSLFVHEPDDGGALELVALLVVDFSPFLSS